jgi:3',5'-cyclic AMP phosphodiesterase CpdA
MASIINTGISRKVFLKKSLQIGAFASSMGVFYKFTVRAESKRHFHVALLADTHVSAYQNEQFRGFFTAKNFELVLKQVSEIHPESVIINGDIARMEGKLGDYTAIQDKLSRLDKEIPVFMTLGNHDDTDNFNNVFGENFKGGQEVEHKHVLVVDHKEVRFILLDSLMYVNKTPGFLGQAQRIWLEKYLVNSDSKPVFIFVHHTLNDGDTDLLDVDRLFKIILPHKKVKSIMYGHSHIYKITDREGLKLINIPAVGYNFIDSQPVGWLEARISPEYGEFKLHAIGGNVADNGKITKVKWG